jgi:hypothetical protein
VFHVGKKILATFVGLTVAWNFLQAGEQVWFRSNFTANTTLQGWDDIWSQRGRKPVRSDYYQVVTENEETYFRSNRQQDGRLLQWGIWHPLGDSGLLVDEKILEICMEAVLRKKKEVGNTVIGFGLTSDRWCERGRVFVPEKLGSGIEILGSENAKKQEINSICSKIQGAMTKLTPPREPYNFLLETDVWQTWRLVYDNVNKEVKFFRSIKEKTPFLVQHDVNLNGILLQAIWISGWCGEFKDVEVTVKTK